MKADLMDLREAPLAHRHRPLFAAFDGMPLGRALELTDSRELESLRELFDATRPTCFAWKELESGPGLWRARIVKTPGEAGCAGCTCQCQGARLAAL
ncbi:DUF2249 domain-containing protein [Inhella gelatinilytica]|uniref:DUF2249 domain-containing protein n=1 Tax=Inhella gelatinilytica TaxID=2795030 RepID=A0A931IWT9_9BURK|nr:DUF2249 domain-containing protein [Inhella gelatinilytica]MBH9552088.1 DUF2249 domain-containing protein [Inhella gelatinilytica]